MNHREGCGTLSSVPNLSRCSSARSPKLEHLPLGAGPDLCSGVSDVAGQVGFDQQESRTRNLLGPGFDSPLLHQRVTVRGMTLDELREHWGSAYVIRQAGDYWTAQRRDTGRMLTADSGNELASAIRADYLRTPVSR
jgi:hypothetical protein